MYYYAMCGTCPAKATWYMQSTNQERVDEWASHHQATYGHAVAKGQAATPFDPRSA